MECYIRLSVARTYEMPVKTQRANAFQLARTEVAGLSPFEKQLNGSGFDQLHIKTLPKTLVAHNENRSPILQLDSQECSHSSNIGLFVLVQQK